MNLRKFLVFVVFFAIISGIGFFAFAQGEDFLGVEDFTIQRIANIITGFACWLIGIVLAVMVVFLVWAGIKFFLARGNDVALADAKKNLTWILVGILVILATNVIIATVANALQPGLNYSLIPLNCGPIGVVTTEETFENCSVDDPECPYGFTCFIPEGQTAGFCIGEGQ